MEKFLSSRQKWGGARNGRPSARLRFLGGALFGPCRGGEGRREISNLSLSSLRALQTETRGNSGGIGSHWRGARSCKPVCSIGICCRWANNHKLTPGPSKGRGTTLGARA